MQFRPVVSSIFSLKPMRFVGISPQEMKRSTEETEEKEQGQQTSKSSIEETEEEEQSHQTGKSKYDHGGGAGSPDL